MQPKHDAGGERPPPHSAACGCASASNIWQAQWNGGPTAGDIGNPSAAKMLGQLQALRLVVRADAPPIEGVGPCQHMFVDETTDDLTVLDDEWHLVGAHL